MLVVVSNAGVAIYTCCTDTCITALALLALAALPMYTVFCIAAMAAVLYDGAV